MARSPLYVTGTTSGRTPTGMNSRSRTCRLVHLCASRRKPKAPIASSSGPSVRTRAVRRARELRVARIVEPLGRECEPRVGRTHAEMIRRQPVGVAGEPAPLDAAVLVVEHFEALHEDAAACRRPRTRAPGRSRSRPWKSSGAPQSVAGLVAAAIANDAGRRIADAETGVDDAVLDVEPVAIVDRQRAGDRIAGSTMSGVGTNASRSAGSRKAVAVLRGACPALALRACRRAARGRPDRACSRSPRAARPPPARSALRRPGRPRDRARGRALRAAPPASAVVASPGRPAGTPAAAPAARSGGGRRPPVSSAIARAAATCRHRRRVPGSAARSMRCTRLSRISMTTGSVARRGCRAAIAARCRPASAVTVRRSTGRSLAGTPRVTGCAPTGPAAP